MENASRVQTPPGNNTGYTTVAILLHWTIALLILSMIPTGWWMVRAINRPESQQLAYQLFQLHKSVGFAILVLSVLRLVWKLTHPAPALPAGMKGWEHATANATHIAFYGLMLVLPLTGWIYVSSGWAISIDRPLEVATSWFGILDVPDIPGLTGNRTIAHSSMGAHRALAYGGLFLVALHIGAALKHHIIDRDAVLAQMIPFLKKYRPDTHTAGHAYKSGLVASHMGIFAIAAVAAFGVWQSLPEPLAEPVIEASQAVETSPPDTVVATSNTSVTPAENPDANATAWDIDVAKSAITFSGTHAGKSFNGTFNDWTGDIRFDPSDLASSKALVTIKTLSARTGDATQESSLKNGEWFNSARFPDAKFEALSFRSLGGDLYEAQGSLTIKRKTVPVLLPFTFRLEGNRAFVEGELQLDRADIDMGMFSDKAAEWVSKSIGVKIAIEATRR